jgi:error-prone DNA polymerase
VPPPTTPPISKQYDHLPHVHEVFSEKEKKEEPKKPRTPQRPYAELRTASAFSFLDGASLPEDLVATAAERDVPAMALIDTNGVYGAPRFFMAAKKCGVKALVGTELVLEGGGRATVLVENREGYKNLCKLVTAGAAKRPKGAARYTWELIAQYAAGLRCLTGGDEGPLAAALAAGGIAAADKALDSISGIFGGRLHVELQRHRRRDEEHRNHALIGLARKRRFPLVATNGVRYARPSDKELHDILTCIREGRNVDTAGQLLGINRERFIKGAAEMLDLFADVPEAVSNAWELSQTLDFTLANLGYQFPDYPLPAGESPMSFLRKITWNSAMTRFRPLTARAQAQVEKELAMIEKLDLAGYFLIVWDIVQFCKRENILVQGRGSAANSAVCYALSITAVDPVRMELLFERFLSEERGEWPDIDLDLPSGDQRERVIQHVYKTYGVHGAAMTANVITYRDRSAARETAKALGFPLEQADKLSKSAATWNFGEIRETQESMAEQITAAGFDPEDLRVRHFMRLQMQIQNLPRHLGQHSGGMVMAKGRLDEVVPLEPASMPGRVVIQWDKEDCADLGIIKVDLLGLGMLAAMEEAIPMIQRCEGVEVDLAHLPEDDPRVYKMLNEADTIGMFQVESRAQMASLPRHAPKCFYDIVVQVAIIRPGPIVGGMIRPFFDRRQGKVPVEYPHPCLEPILKRTLGVPLFQEQLLRIAMVAANFTGGEAEELRRAMGFKRSMERMHEIEKRLRDGMTKNGIEPAAQDQIVKSITSFALYGFPESHAASFALIAYASAYLKAHHPAAFYVSLLNAWPMGFYHPATLVKDAQRRGVKVFPVDVNHSGWMSRWERGGVRLGLRFVRGLRETSGRAIERAQTFTSADDLARRAKLRDDQMTKLAYAGALASLGLTRRGALWQAALAAKDSGELFAGNRPTSRNPLADMSRTEETMSDYDSMHLTTGPHLLEHFRPQLKRDGVVSAAALKKLPNGQRVTTAGAVIVRQRPGTAKGFVFLTLEDETGISQAIIHPDLFREQRALIVSSSGLIVEGTLQNLESQPSVRAERFWPLEGIGEVVSHDFH